MFNILDYCILITVINVTLLLASAIVLLVIIEVDDRNLRNLLGFHSYTELIIHVII